MLQVRMTPSGIGVPHFQPDGLRHHHGLREPVRQILRPVDGDLEVLLRVDLVQPVDRRRQQLGGQLCGLEREADIGVVAHPRARADLAAPEREPAADGSVHRRDLRDEVALLQPRAEGGMPACGEFQHLRQPEQDEREFHALVSLASCPRFSGRFLRRAAVAAECLLR
jgi:hypothetical protein